MDRRVFVYVDVAGQPILAGNLWTRAERGLETATFQYDETWLQRPAHFSLGPALKAASGSFHSGTNRPFFGAISDSSPDRWGRTLMRRAERARAKRAGTAPRTLTEIDFLLGVNDFARQGALRFAEQLGGPFLSDDRPIPPLVDLRSLLQAAELVLDDKESDNDLRLLLAPGSSLGGARPKASVLDQNGSLLVAKFSSPSDDTDIVRWEAVALTLAQKAAGRIPTWRLEIVVNKPVLLLERFDRTGSHRIPFLSAMSMLGAGDNDQHSYLEIADALAEAGASPANDRRELWRRIVFSILISNTDDHLRNHGFLYDSAGWRLAPAYDLNPVPVDVKPRILTTAINEDDGTASLELAFEVADYFGLNAHEARLAAFEIGTAVATWREEAQHIGVPRPQIDRMESAFEHEDLAKALGSSRPLSS